ncbi:MAG: isoamylase early set domain-containing protein, partial [Fibrobacteraceae bacterium]|nr:isoamylase early set domain-containing protein [Fibrobacteraceae bacterium]
MKKLFAFISVLALMSAALFADVSAKKNADGSVAVTFFYGNPRATEVLLAGDFTNWQDGALPMEKGEKGFSITVNFKAGDEGRYKFISDGNWTTDLRAPDFVDDGFGGKNSHIVIADLLGGDEGDSGAAKAKINFVSWTMIGVQGNYITRTPSDYLVDEENSEKIGDTEFTIKSKSGIEKGLDLESVTIGMKSYNKFVGNFLPNCPLY